LLIAPPLVTRPIESSLLVNHSAPSGPVVIHCGWLMPDWPTVP
jgi:hypothetical protein